MDNELIRLLVKRCRSLQPSDIRAVAQLRLCICTHDSEVLHERHPLLFLLWRHHVLKSRAEHRQVQCRHALPHMEERPELAISIVVDEPIIFVRLPSTIKLLHVVDPHFSAVHFVEAVVVCELWIFDHRLH